MDKRVKLPNYQCLRCGHPDGGHHNQCPEVGGNSESFEAGKAAARDHDNCYAPMGTAFELGWSVEVQRMVRRG